MCLILYVSLSILTAARRQYDRAIYSYESQARMHVFWMRDWGLQLESIVASITIGMHVSKRYTITRTLPAVSSILFYETLQSRNLSLTAKRRSFL